MRKPWSLWGIFKPILDFFSLQERLVSVGRTQPLVTQFFFPNTMQFKYSNSPVSFHSNSHHIFCGKNTEKKSLIRKFGTGRRQGVWWPSVAQGLGTGVMTDLLKTESKAQGENTSSEVKDPEGERSSQIQDSSLWDPLVQATCLAGLSGTDWVPLELESKSSSPNCDIHSISIEPSVCQTQCLPLPRDLGGSVFLCHDHCVRLL